MPSSILCHKSALLCRWHVCETEGAHACTCASFNQPPWRLLPNSTTSTLRRENVLLAHLASSACWLQVRLAAVQAVTPLVLLLGARAVLLLTGWQDPHQVPVASFFEPTTHVNHCALLAQDASWRVSRCSDLPGWFAGPDGWDIWLWQRVMCVWSGCCALLRAALPVGWSAMCSWRIPRLSRLDEGDNTRLLSGHQA